MAAAFSSALAKDFRRSLSGGDCFPAEPAERGAHFQWRDSGAGGGYPAGSGRIYFSGIEQQRLHHRATGGAVAAQETKVEIKSDKSGLVTLPRSVSLGQVVKALNAVGATPQDLLAILQAMKTAGALHAELEII
jgi:hypothetical protein